jgi:hypothetical protein
MKKRLVCVSDFSVTDNHLYFPSDPKQKYLSPVDKFFSSNVYLIVNCGDEL